MNEAIEINADGRDTDEMYNESSVIIQNFPFDELDKTVHIIFTRRLHVLTRV